ncbi:hypothetical protein QR680_013610 [Steinernema hermaphroditum]|uniref:BZIP domain-containing protein n=1 Tax=Steinernema hermaphroditum TaxID=289476 RepID=A0AA39M2T3_9BILA|nr:hypothetical protein QR680_013610 [Steinernema hermaphroditum]
MTRPPSAGDDLSEPIKDDNLLTSAYVVTTMVSFLRLAFLVMPYALAPDRGPPDSDEEEEERKRNRENQRRFYYKQREICEKLQQDLDRLKMERDHLIQLLAVQSLEAEEYAQFLRDRDCPSHTPSEAFLDKKPLQQPVTLHSARTAPDGPVAGPSTVIRTPHEIRLEKSRKFRMKSKRLGTEIADLVDEVAKLQWEIDAHEARHRKLLKLSIDCERSCDKLDLKDFNDFCVEVIRNGRWF